jgi:transcriptional regulator with XRE-family HTH domain
VESHLSKGLAFQIRSLREKEGWSQQCLAEKICSNQNSVYRAENPNYGKHTLTTLKKIAAAFDVALVVRFVPFSELVDWVSGTPRIVKGLNTAALEASNFSQEYEQAPILAKKAPVGYKNMAAALRPDTLNPLVSHLYWHAFPIVISEPRRWNSLAAALGLVGPSTSADVAPKSDEIMHGTMAPALSQSEPGAGVVEDSLVKRLAPVIAIDSRYSKRSMRGRGVRATQQRPLRKGMVSHG